MVSRREKLISWFNKGITDNAEYMILAFDLLDQKELPIYIYSDQNVVEEMHKCNESALEPKFLFVMRTEMIGQIESALKPEHIIVSNVIT